MPKINPRTIRFDVHLVLNEEYITGIRFHPASAENNRVAGIDIHTLGGISHYVRGPAAEEAWKIYKETSVPIMKFEE